MKNKIILIVAIICVALIGYLLSMKNKQAPQPVPSAINGLVTPTTTPTADNNAPTTFPAPATDQVPVPAAAGTVGEVDGVPAGAPAPAESGIAADQGTPVGMPAAPAAPAGVPAPAAGGAGLTPPAAPTGVPEAPVGTAPTPPPGGAPVLPPAAAQ